MTKTKTKTKTLATEIFDQLRRRNGEQAAREVETQARVLMDRHNCGVEDLALVCPPPPEKPYAIYQPRTTPVRLPILQPDVMPALEEWKHPIGATRRLIDCGVEGLVIGQMRQLTGNRIQNFVKLRLGNASTTHWIPEANVEAANAESERRG